MASALGNANTPTGLTNSQLLGWIQTNVYSSGTSFSNSQVAPLLGSAGTPTMAQIRQQLTSAGYSTGRIAQILNSAPATFRQIMGAIGGAVIAPVGIGVGPATGTAGTAAEGGAAASGAGAAAGTAAGKAAGT